MNTHLPHRLQASGLNNGFRLQDASFADYVEQACSMIQRARVDQNHAQFGRICELNAPYELQPSSGKVKHGILLVHGLYDSPFTMRNVGRFFQAQGFLVRNILLPGHGTRPGDLLKTQLASWQATVDFGLASLLKDVEHVHAAGFSTGAALIFQQALHGAPYKSLFLFAPAFTLKTRFAFIANWHRLYSWAYRKGRWLTLADDLDYVKYESHTMNGVHQLRLLLREIKHWQSHALPPLFMALSAEDEVIDSRATVHMFQKMVNDKNRLLLFSQKEQTFDDPHIHVINSPILEKNILNFSHACIPIDRDNSHYGEDGDYHDFLHYRYNKTIKRPSPDSELYFGALTSENLRHYHLERLHYNPKFEAMTEAMADFLKKR